MWLWWDSVIKHVVGNITAVRLRCYKIEGQARWMEEVKRSKEDLSVAIIILLQFSPMY